MAKVEFKGLDNLKQNFQSLVKSIEEQAVTAAENAAAEVFKDAIVAAAPRDTGQGAESVEIVESKDRKLLAMTAGSRSGRLYVGPTKKKGFYLYWIDKGWKRSKGRRARGAQGTTHSQAGTEEYEIMEGTHWFEKAVKAVSGRAEEVYRRVFAAKVEEISRRLK